MTIPSGHRIRRPTRAGLALRLLLLALGWCISLGVAAQALGGNTSEEKVKAAYLYRFISYVEWPPAAVPRSDEPYVVGVAGSDEVADELAAISSGRMVNGHPVLVRKLREDDTIAGMHVLFLGAGARPQALLRQAQQQPILIVTESEGALGQGSMINFRLVDDRLRFEIALAPAERAGLKFNSRMLGVAYSVIKGSAP
ncbi:YfiR family protein [Noviherbaspirillum galbum]|uniref:YfiR family protein n=1 Tax=Noviherbaspirillum galbum TaxID=2709383 RepID=A0A6B3SJL8_9BURK|nr:YfiR family protein [Noviherbaspirillum galbum]NEX59545.1 YfiR family protein [Noviherbaspirillum galbum]